MSLAEFAYELVVTSWAPCVESVWKLCGLNCVEYCVDQIVFKNSVENCAGNCENNCAKNNGKIENELNHNE